MGEVPYVGDVLRDAPKNWGTWGENDEVGALNYLSAADVLAAVGTVRHGAVYSLQRPVRGPEHDLIWPTRQPSSLAMTRDESSWDLPNPPAFPGGFHTADDRIEMALQGTTHVDALGHVWYDGELYNGYDARSTIGGLERASIEPIGARGIVGRGVLLDMAAHFGVPAMHPGQSFDHRDLEACAVAQGVELRLRDIIVIRTNYLSRFEEDPEQFWATFDEPGLRYSAELVEWFQDLQIPALATDTMANETTKHTDDGAVMYLHCALMRNLGVVFVEMCDLEQLASACAADGSYEFLFTAAPMRVAGAAGSPVNPLAIK